MSQHSSRLALALVLAAPSVYAQTSSQTEAALKLEVRGLYTDNFYYSDDNAQAVSGLLISPSLRLLRSGKHVQFGVRAMAEVGTFSFGAQDNYVDSQIGTNAAIHFSDASHLTLGIDQHWSHDRFGTERTIGREAFDRELDQWELSSAAATLKLGDDERSRLGLELDARHHELKYTTNVDLTRYLDRSNDQGRATALFRFSPKLALTASGLFADIQYAHTAPDQTDRSGTVTAALLGIRWSATAKTSGDIRFGRGMWNPDATEEADQETSFWQAALTWRPSQTSEVTASTQRQYKPTFRFDAQFIDERQAQLRWQHNWTYRVYSTMTVEAAKRGFVGTSELFDTKNVRLRLNYRLDLGVNTFVSVGQEERIAVDSTHDYSSIQAYLGFTADLN